MAQKKHPTTGRNAEEVACMEPLREKLIVESLREKLIQDKRNQLS